MDENYSIIIGDVEQFSIVDFPDKIVAVAFLQGCPWRCPFCYNTSLQKIGAQPESNWTFEKFLAFLKKRRNVLDGVVFSGGEPLVHNDLYEAISAVKNLGYAVGLHTGGYRPEALSKVLPLLDWVGLDIKAPLEKERYKQITGGVADVQKVQESLALLIQSGLNFECRTTCDPRMLSKEDIYQIAETLQKAGVKKYYIQKYRPIPTDKTTSDSMCAELVEDAELNAYLKKSFEVFEVRK